MVANPTTSNTDINFGRTGWLALASLHTSPVKFEKSDRIPTTNDEIGTRYQDPNATII
jgi:hypothetical protein